MHLIPCCESFRFLTSVVHEIPPNSYILLIDVYTYTHICHLRHVYVYACMCVCVCMYVGVCVCVTCRGNVPFLLHEVIDIRVTLRGLAAIVYTHIAIIITTIIIQLC